jgi:hypothetical protein
MNSSAIIPVDLAQFDQSLRRALSLLRQRFLHDQDKYVGGGWYHQLEAEDPGATATAVGLMVFDSCNEVFERTGDALAFLSDKQLKSDDPLIDGGWATNTSLGHPVVEATGWIARMIGTTRCALVPGAPSAERAHRWLVENQNQDGGWGSLRGCPSRTWLTCVALRGLLPLDPWDPAIQRGVAWLLSHRNNHVDAWGETATAPVTVTHTAMVLLTLAEVMPPPTDDAIVHAYQWLAEKLEADASFDRHAQQETYPVTAGPARFRLNLWHYGMPVAVAALLRHPDGPPAGLMGQAFSTILHSQNDRGYWLSSDSGTSMSLWGVWWCTQALSDLRRVPLAQPGDLLYWVPDALIVQRSRARGRPLTSLIPTARRIDARRFLRRHWATMLLGAWLAAALAVTAVGLFSWQEYAIGTVFPVLLLVISEGFHRRPPRSP